LSQRISLKFLRPAPTGKTNTSRTGWLPKKKKIKTEKRRKGFKIENKKIKTTQEK
jgi:hypothetical protein